MSTRTADESRRCVLAGVTSVAVGTDLMQGWLSGYRLVTPRTAREMAELMLRVAGVSVVDFETATRSRTPILQLEIEQGSYDRFGALSGILRLSLDDVVIVVRNDEAIYARTWTAGINFQSTVAEMQDNLRQALSAIVTGFCNDVLAANGRLPDPPSGGRLRE